MEMFCRNPSPEDLWNCQNAMKFLLRKAQKDKFWASRNCKRNSTSSAHTRRSHIVRFGVLFVRHNLTGRAAANKLMLKAQTTRERLRWCRRRRQFRTNYWKQYLFTDEWRFKLRSDGRLEAAVRMNDAALAVRYDPLTIVGHFTLGCLCLRWDGTLYQSTQKRQFVWTISILWKKPEFSFSRNWDTSWLTTMLQFIALIRLMNGNMLMASNLIRGQRSLRIWAPVKIFGFLSKLSYEVRNLNSQIFRAQFATFRTKFSVNWCPSCTSRCHNVFRNAFGTQASQQNIDIIVVFVFSIRFIAYEVTLYERRLLIRQCRWFSTKKNI